MSEQPIVMLSEVDSERYGISIARAKDVTQDNFQSIMDFCHEQGVQMLIARTRTTHLPVAQTMESHGFRIMDTLVYYQFDFNRADIPENRSDISVRSATASDERAVGEVARDAFRGYYGHYHADPRLDTRDSNEAYVAWAMQSCTSREFADEVLVAEYDGAVVGFATLRMNNPQEGEGVLFGVASHMQGHGIYRSFMIHAMAWCKHRGAERIVVSTQITNIAVQKVWSRLGFHLSHAYYTFHKWFDE